MEAVLKEWYWPVILFAIVMMAFSPSFLKARCPSCRKRKLVSAVPDERVKAELLDAEQGGFITFYLCEGCGGRFWRDRSGPYQDASGQKWAIAFESSESATTV